MSEYNGNWKLFEGTKMNVVELTQLVESKEKEHWTDVNKVDTKIDTI